MSSAPSTDTAETMDRVFAAGLAKFRTANRGPFLARSASDRTDDWLHWFVADRSGINVTVYLDPRLRGCLPFLNKGEAVRLAGEANNG